MQEGSQEWKEGAIKWWRDAFANGTKTRKHFAQWCAKKPADLELKARVVFHSTYPNGTPGTSTVTPPNSEKQPSPWRKWQDREYLRSMMSKRDNT